MWTALAMDMLLILAQARGREDYLIFLDPTR